MYGTYGELQATRVKVHEYIGTTINFFDTGKSENWYGISHQEHNRKMLQKDHRNNPNACGRRPILYGKYKALPKKRLSNCTPMLIRAYSRVITPFLIFILSLQLYSPIYIIPQLTIGKRWYECSSISMKPVIIIWSYWRKINMLLSCMWDHTLLCTLRHHDPYMRRYPIYFSQTQDKYLKHHWS